MHTIRVTPAGRCAHANASKCLARLCGDCPLMMAFQVGLAVSENGFKWAKKGVIFQGSQAGGSFDERGVAARHVVSVVLLQGCLCQPDVGRSVIPVLSCKSFCDGLEMIPLPRSASAIWYLTGCECRRSATRTTVTTSCFMRLLVPQACVHVLEICCAWRR